MRNISLLLLLLINQLTYSQIKDYFLPSEKYWDNTFYFESNTWENDNGVYQTKNQVKYSKDPSGNFKRYVFKQTLRYNIPEIPVRHHQFFNITDSKVTNIATYVEGISEIMVDLGLIDDIKNKEIVLKMPSAKWLYDEKSEIYSSYSSSKGELKTKYGYYPDCIIVTQQVRTKSKIKWIDKYYYAKGLGIVKTEGFKNGKLIEVEMGFGTLVDDFSEYSFVQREAIKKIEEEKAKIAAENKRKINEFLATRMTKKYDYKTVNNNDYKKIEEKIEKFLIQELSKEDKSVLFNLSVSLTNDFQGKSNVKTNFSSNPDNVLKLKIEQFIHSIALPQSFMFEDYTINTFADYLFICKVDIKQCNIKVGGKATNFDKECENTKEEIISKQYPDGKYITQTKTISVDEYLNKSLEIKSFKSFGGSGYCIFSLFVPGTGDYFVNGGKGSMLGKDVSPVITTVTTLGLVGSGIYFKSQSNKNYDLYHAAIEQSEIDKYYDLANNQNKASYILIGIGAALWLWDVIWTAKTGSENKKANEFMKDKLSFSPILLDNRNLGIGLTYNF